MAHKYKVGDRFRLLRDGHETVFYSGYHKGQEFKITRLYEDDSLKLNNYELADHVGDAQWANEEELERDCEHVTDPEGPTPAHYIAGRAPEYEPRFVIKAWGLGYNLGSAVKYISRYGRKGTPADHVRDLEKAIDFIRFELEDARAAAKDGAK